MAFADFRVENLIELIRMHKQNPLTSETRLCLRHAVWVLC